MKIKLLFLFVLSIAITNALYSQGFNTIVSPDGVTVLASGNQGRIFRSVNGGQTFASYTINASVNYMNGYSTGNFVWLAGSDGMIYRTNSNNLILTALNTGVTTSLNSICFTNINNGFSCGDNGVVIKTSDGGNNWTSINSGLIIQRYNSISFLDSLNGAVAGDNGKIYLTSNGGNSWLLQTTGTTKNILKIKYFQGGLTAAGEYGILLMKPNAGVWTNISTRIETDIRGISGTDFINIHLCGGGGFIRNNRNGSGKFLNFEANPMVGDLKDIFYIDTLTGYAVSSLNNAIIKTTNGGNNWAFTAGTTLTYNWVQKLTTTSGIGNNLCRHPYDRNSMFCMFGNRVYLSRDRGENWTQISSTSLGSPAHTFFVSPIDTNIWLASVESAPDKVIRTTDYGITWNTILSINFSNYGTPLEIDQNNPSVFYYAPDGGGFYKSTNSGANFTEISGNYPFRSPCDITVMYDSSNVIYLADGITGSGLGNIFKSTNSGVNWVQVHTNSSSSEIPAISNSIFDRSIAYATNWSGGAIYKTVNYGDNWSLLRTNSGSGWATDICREDPTFVITGSYGASTYISNDDGKNFTTVSIGGGSGGGQIAPERGYVLDMRSQGIFKLVAAYNIITEVKENLITGIPSRFELFQNYPNPFNPTTNIKYQIINNNFVTLKIYDILGRVISSLVNEMQSTGIYEITWDASKYPSGVYFYRLETGNYSEIKRMTVLK